MPSLRRARRSNRTGPSRTACAPGSRRPCLLAAARRTREAAEVLARASEDATSPAEAAEVGIARVELALAAGDEKAAREAARALLLAVPTADASKSTPEAVRRMAARVERELTPADRGRRGAALVAAGDARRGVRLLGQDPASAWPPGDRAANQAALASGLYALKKPKDAEAAAARVPDDGSAAAGQARLLRCDIVLSRLRKGGAAPTLSDPRLEPVVRALEALTAPGVPDDVRRGAEQRLLRLEVDAEDFDAALARARELTEAAPATIDGFEPLWLAAWRLYLAGDYAGARARIEALAAVYSDISRSRRLAYWRARCLLVEGRGVEARAVFDTLAAARPPDLYARFSRTRAPRPTPVERPPLGDPSTATAAFARVDELMRLRLFEEAVAEARMLPPSRGRDLRLAQADFALGRFLAAALAVKRALPEIGTAEEGRVPDSWRRLYYPIEEGGNPRDASQRVRRGRVRSARPGPSRKASSTRR